MIKALGRTDTISALDAPPLALVTGANGFVGRRLSVALRDQGWRVRGSVRGAAELDAGVERAVVGDLGTDTDWSLALSGVDSVFHLAARVHQLSDPHPDPAAEYLRVNCHAAAHLARCAAAAGVRRLVLASSVKAMGEETRADSPWTEESACRPPDPYGRSKLEAETAVHEIAAGSALESVVLRLPLVYGPGVKANMERLFLAVRAGRRLPLGSVRNRRSMVAVSNLCSALIACAQHPAAAGRTYLVSDDADFSTPELIRAMARALDTRARLVPVPTVLFRMGGWLGDAAGWVLRRDLPLHSGVVRRLLGSLVVDCSRLRTELNWQPVCTPDQELAATAAALPPASRN